jgi:hypothetical protein
MDDQKLLPPAEPDNRIRTSDINALRDEMLAGMLQLESALFKQAGFESERLKLLRGFLNKVEEDLLNEDVYSRLSDRDKVSLYRLLLSNMEMSTNFMLNFHKSITTGVETVSQMERLEFIQNKERAKVLDAEADREVVQEIRDKLHDLIKKKSLDKLNSAKHIPHEPQNT